MIRVMATMLNSNKSSIEQRIKEIKKELSAVNSDLKSLSKSVEKGDFVKLPKTKSYEQGGPVSVSAAPATMSQKTVVQTAASRTEPVALPTTSPALSREQAQAARRDRDPRLADYLSANYDTSVRPMKYERKLQRNKAIVMVVIVAILLFFVLYKFFQVY